MVIFDITKKFKDIKKEVDAQVSIENSNISILRTEFNLRYLLANRFIWVYNHFMPIKQEFSAKTLSRHSGESRNPEDGRETLDCRVIPHSIGELLKSHRVSTNDSRLSAGRQ
jgi:hypothetical protein